MAFFYDPFMKSLEKSLIKSRREMLQNIQGDVLEVGAGTGVNFDFYSERAKVYAIEPSVPMYQRALKRAKKNIKVYNTGIESVENIAEMPEKFDYVISMLVLCTVDDAQEAAKIYHKLLKDDGRLLVLEHIHSSGTAYGKLQKLVNPIWKPIADGCNLTRRQDHILKKNGFFAMEEKYFRLGTDWYQAIMKKIIST